MVLINTVIQNSPRQSFIIHEQKRQYKHHDQLFKQLIRPFFKQFIKAFYPNIYRQINFKKTTYLSEEIYTATYKGDKRILDLVVEANLKETNEPIIIHIEPQSYVQTDFNDRMFKYFSLLYNEFAKPILPIAIFSYEQSWNKSEFSSTILQTNVLQFNYLTLHLKQLNWRDFSEMENPVSAALLSKMNYTNDERVYVKLACLSVLAKLKLTREMNNLVLGFFESYLQLSVEEEEMLMKEASELKNGEEILKLTVSYEERGKEIGEGIGRAIGRTEKEREIALEMLREGMEEQLIMKFTQLNLEELKQLKSQLKK